MFQRTTTTLKAVGVVLGLIAFAVVWPLAALLNRLQERRS